jgi:L-ascorbate metabolism protein UlaG (beta-lactamase superfamily)
MTPRFTTLTYAGHSAVFLNAPAYTAAIDPWLNNPLCPEGLKTPAKLNLIVLTHGHADHASDVPMLAKRTGAKVAATYELAQILAKEGVPEGQLIFMNKGGCISVDGLTVSLVHALHSNSFDTKSGPVYAGEACGVVVKDGHSSIYHAGDTALFSDMKLIGEVHKPTVACLPIGDCFTMGPKDAARAAELIGAPTVVPIHYATFPLLTGTAAAFEAACYERCGDKGSRVVTLEPGATLSL